MTLKEAFFALVLGTASCHNGQMNWQDTFGDATGDGKIDYILMERTYPEGAAITVISDASTKDESRAKTDTKVTSHVGFPSETILTDLLINSKGLLETHFRASHGSYKLCFRSDNEGNYSSARCP